jgi:hypothetical protein
MWALAGGRAWYVAEEWLFFVRYPLAVFTVQDGGLAARGRLLGGFWGLRGLVGTSGAYLGGPLASTGPGAGRTAQTVSEGQEEAGMQSNVKWFVGAALAVGLLVGSLVSTGVSAQTATPPGSSGPGVCPGYGMMGGGFGPGARVGAFGPGVELGAIANALGICSQELWDARTAAKNVAELAREKNIDLTKACASSV